MPVRQRIIARGLHRKLKFEQRLAGEREVDRWGARDSVIRTVRPGAARAEHVGEAFCRRLKHGVGLATAPKAAQNPARRAALRVEVFSIVDARSAIAAESSAVRAAIRRVL